MKYQNMYKDLPQDIRPMGTNNLEQLVHHQLGSNSFDKVAEVQSNLPFIYALYYKLPLIQKLGSSADSIELLAQHTCSLSAIAQSMPALNAIYRDLELISANFKYTKTLAQDINRIQNLLAMFHGQISERAMENLLERYAQVEDKLTATENEITKISKLEKSIENINILLLHFLATEAVNNAYYQNTPQNISLAKNAIKASTQAGNDETINKKRLGEL